MTEPNATTTTTTTTTNTTATSKMSQNDDAVNTTTDKVRNASMNEAVGRKGELRVTINSWKLGELVADNIVIPLFSVLQRELEMKETALKFGISEDRWNGSLLYNKWKETKQVCYILTPEEQGTVVNNGNQDDNEKVTKTISTIPPVECWWDDWLTELIGNYYDTGKLKVPACTKGFDLLLAVEFFGILYQPDQLAFESFKAYHLVKQWSNYYMHRASMADFVNQIVTDASESASEREIKQLMFGTSFSELEETICLGTKKLPLLGDGKADPKLSSNIMYDFFNGAENAKVSVTSENTATAMRIDFVRYLHKLLNQNCSISFPTMAVTAKQSEDPVIRRVSRAVLLLEINNPKPPEESIVDKMDTLLMQVEERNASTIGSNTGESPRSAIDFDLGQIQHVYEDLADKFNGEKKSQESAHPGHANSEEESSKKIRAVFDIPDHLLPQKESPAPVGVVETKAFDLISVPSALTGPYYIDDDGHLRDAFESDKRSDDDERAQAERHEWIQAALLNHGIRERVEELLKTDLKNKNGNKAMCNATDTWDWLTGLGICDFTRSFVQSMERCGPVNVQDVPEEKCNAKPLQKIGDMSALPIPNKKTETKKSDFNPTYSLPIDEETEAPFDEMQAEAAKSTDGVTVREHLCTVQQQLADEQSRQDSGQKNSEQSDNRESYNKLSDCLAGKNQTEYSMASCSATDLSPRNSSASHATFKSIPTEMSLTGSDTASKEKFNSAKCAKVLDKRAASTANRMKGRNLFRGLFRRRKALEG